MPIYLKNRIILIEDEIPKIDKKHKIEIINDIEIKDVNKVCKMVIEANKKVIFEQIYYIPLEKTLVMETEEKLNLEVWEQELENSLYVSGENSFIKYLQKLFINVRMPKLSEVTGYEIGKAYQKVQTSFKQAKNRIKEEIDILLFFKNIGYNFVSKIDYNYKNNIVILEFDRKDKYSFKISFNEIIDSPLPFLNDTILKIRDLYREYEDFYLSELKLKSTSSKFYLKGNMMGFKIYLKTLNDQELITYTYDENSNDFLVASWKDLYLNYVIDSKEYIIESIYFAINDLPIWLQKELLKAKKGSLQEKRTLNEKIRRFLKNIF